MKKKKKKRRGGMGIIRAILFAAALCVFLYSAYQLYIIYHGYAAADAEYDGLADEFTKPVGEKEPDSTPTPTPTPQPVKSEEGQVVDIIEDAEPPVEVDWENLKAINPDIVGWLYVDAQNNINYPICHTTDNEYYLHKTFRREYLYAGSIFEECLNSGDFTDPNTIVYGHNMKSGSMFGMLKYLRDQGKYDSGPYFWILTPQGNYRYHIYAAFQTAVDSEVYNIFTARGKEFLEWEKRLQAASEVSNSVPLTENDFTVTLSTCTSDSSVRCVVIGKCVSSAKPVKAAKPAS